MSESEIQVHHSKGADSNLTSGPDASENLGWQARLLPLMKGMIIILALFFFAASFYQLAYQHRELEKAPTTDISRLLVKTEEDQDASYKDRLNAASLNADIALEENTIARRYHQASVLLMAGLWVRYMGFVTGMILAFVGAVFVLGKLQVQTTEIAGKIGGHEASLKSASPGIITLILGATLMLVTITTQQKYNLTDAAVYLHSRQQNAFGLDTSGGKPKFNYLDIQDSGDLGK